MVCTRGTAQEVLCRATLKGVTLSHSQKRSSQAGLVNFDLSASGMNERKVVTSIALGIGGVAVDAGLSGLYVEHLVRVKDGCL